VGSRLFFRRGAVAVTAATLWTSDGTGAGTLALGDGLDPFWMTPFGGQLVFSGRAASGEREPWASDGTPAGTAPLADVNPGAASSDPEHFVDVGGRLFFSAIEAATGDELWATDGTGAGTA